MLYIFLIIFALMITIGIICYKNNNEAVGAFLGAFGAFFFVIDLAILLSLLNGYNSIKTTAKEKIAVYEEQNEIVLKQLEPLTNKYIDFEKDVYKDLKPTAENILLLCQTYPELKSDTFVLTQINIILSNQQEITNLRLSLAGLNAYKLWIWLGA